MEKAGVFFVFFYEAKKRYVDYDALYDRLKQGPITFTEIMEFIGRNKADACQVITTMSLRFPIWSPQRGVYRLMTYDDYEQDDTWDDDDEFEDWE